MKCNACGNVRCYFMIVTKVEILVLMVWLVAETSVHSQQRDAVKDQ